MSRNEISGGESLSRQIAQLKAERAENEKEIIWTYQELTQLVFNPVMNIPEKIGEKRKIKREMINLSKIVLNRSTDYIIEQRFGKRQKFRVFLTSVLIEVAANPLINRNIAMLISGIYKQIFGKTEYNEQQ
jgi:hypothetical protein